LNILQKSKHPERDAVEKFATVDNEQAQQVQIDDFLVFPQQNSDNDEARAYLESPNSSYEMLNGFPKVKKVFKKFNTPLNSSGAIERVFNLAGVLNHPKRGSITPANFEMCMFLKADSVYNKV